MMEMDAEIRQVHPVDTLLRGTSDESVADMPSPDLVVMVTALHPAILTGSATLEMNETTVQLLVALRA